jgi:hypothetical protein
LGGRGSRFQVDIQLYDVPGNINGKMSQKVYLKSILKLIVKSWLDQGHISCWKKMVIRVMALEKQHRQNVER